MLRASISARISLGGVTAAAVLVGAPVPLVILLAAVTAIAATPSYPALAAVTPQVIPIRQLAAANSLATGVENAAWVAGPGVLGVVLLTGAPVWGGCVAAVACFTAGRLALGDTSTPVPVARSGPAATWADGPPAAAPDRPEGHGRLGDELAAGVRAVVGETKVLAAFVIAMLDNFLYGYLVVALVLVGTDALGLAEAGIGVLTTAFAAGALASFAINQRLADPGREAAVLLGGMVGFTAVTGGLALTGSVTAVTALLVAAGLLTLVVEVVAVTFIQRTAAQEVAARVFGLCDTVAIALIAIGSALAGVLSETVGLAHGLLAVASLTAVLTLGCAMAMARSQTPESTPPDPDGGIATSEAA